jgi:arylsulfatase A-like enzyme
VPTHTVLPTGTNRIAWSDQLNVALENGTSFGYSPYAAVPDWVMRDQRHAYYASVSYVDEHVGHVLQTLEETKLAQNTIILFHADHVRTRICLTRSCSIGAYPSRCFRDITWESTANGASRALFSLKRKSYRVAPKVGSTLGS